MKKLLFTLLFVFVGAAFFVLPASANTFQQKLGPHESVYVTLSGGYYNVDVQPGYSVVFNWSVISNAGATVDISDVSVISAGSGVEGILSSGTVDLSSATQNSGWATFLNTTNSSFVDIDLSVTVGFTIYNPSDSIVTPRILLQTSNIVTDRGQYIVPSSTINSKLNQILDSIGDSSYFVDFLGDDALFYVRSDYFSNSFGCSFNSDGWIDVSSWSDFGVYNWSLSNTPGYQFSPGTYLVYVMRPGGVEPDSIVFEDIDSSLYSFDRVFVSSELSGGYYFEVFLLDIKEFFAYSTLHFHYTGSATDSLPVYIGFAVASDDYLAGSSVNPSQSDLVDSVDDAGKTQSSQEEQLWNNINSYKGDLTFNLDDWSEAADGLSYISSIFMSIWNNSPTQIIILSLMLGIAMLSIGRGVNAAVRVSRHRDDD